MPRKALATLLLSLTLLFLPASRAEVVLGPAHRFPNKEPGYCVWVSLQMLGHRHGIKPLLNIVKQREDMPWTVMPWSGGRPVPRHAGNARMAREHLRGLGVKFLLADGPEAAYRLLREACKDGKGGVAGLIGRDRHRCPVGDHAVVVTDVGRDDVHFVDCNDKDSDYYWDLGTFRYFLEWAVVVEPEPDAKEGEK